MQEYAFVQAAMAVATVAFFWMGAAFPVGAMKGSRAGMRVLRSGVWILLGGTALVMAWAAVAGELSEFFATFGALELLEMAGFVAMFEFIVYFMADRYLVDKAAEEAAIRNGSEEVETEDG